MFTFKTKKDEKSIITKIDMINIMMSQMSTMTED